MKAKRVLELFSNKENNPGFVSKNDFTLIVRNEFGFNNQEI
jgi:hypothetical protein